MMRPLAFALAIALSMACSGKSKGPDPDDDQADGKVVEVTGEVTAQRRGSDEVRTLEVGAPVYGNDSVTTGEDSSVKIQLLHNQAVLLLDASMKRTLHQTAAWRASTGKSGLFDEASGSQTAAAGRHAERQGADTRATAADREEVMKAEEPATEIEPDVAEILAGDKLEPRHLRESDEVPPDDTGGGERPFDTGKDSPADVTSKGPPPDGTAKLPKRAPEKGASGPSSRVRFARVAVVEGKPSKKAVAGLQTRLEHAYAKTLRVCHERLLATEPDASGTVSITLEVGADGRVVSAQAKAFHGTIGTCVESEAETWQFDPLEDDSGNAIAAAVRLEVELEPE